MTGKNPQKIRFWKTISFRILIVVAALLAAAVIAMHFLSRSSIERQVNETYRIAGELIAELTALNAQQYKNDFTEFADSAYAEQLRILCREMLLQDVYIRTSTPPYLDSVEAVYISANRIEKRTRKTEGGVFVFEVTKEEERIYSGETDHSVTVYMFREKVYISYLHGIYDSAGHCIAICGADFLDSEIVRSRNELIWRESLILGLILLGLMAALILLLHFLVARPVSRISEGMRGLVENDTLRSEKLEVSGSDEISLMAADFNSMTDDIREYIRTVQSVDAAAHIQAGMLPKERYEDEQVSISACMKPARNVGGDFYDYFAMEDGRIFLVIADVSGKGISAALFMAGAVNAIRYNAKLFQTPAQILKAANNDIALRNPEQLFITVFLAVYDPFSGELTCANGGHNPPYLLRGGRLIPLDHEPDLLLGLFEDEPYENVKIPVQKGDILFLYTDGLNEAVSPEKRFLGTEGLEEILKETAEDAAGTESFTDAVLCRIEEFENGAEQHDDITMLAAKFSGSAKSSLTLPADLKEIGSFRSFLMENPLIPGAERKKIYLAAEEIFVNICSYAYNGCEKGTVQLELERTADCLEMRFSDSGIPYDPLKDIDPEKEYDPDTMIGGLGKKLAFQIMDQQAYEYQDGRNVLTLRKKIGGKNYDDQ